MLHPRFTLFIALFFIAFIPLNAQAGDLFNILDRDYDYSVCAAILYKGNVLVDDYSPKGRCFLEKGMTGKLSISTVSLSETATIPQKTLKFHVAIKNKDTNTLFMITKEAILEIELEDILKQCKRGDIIVFLTVDKQYSLTHHEIDVITGC